MIDKRTFGFLVAALLAAASSRAAEPERQTNMRQGPETVFDRPVSELFGELKGATATGDDGRVGNELVFWSYRLADGRSAYLYACAPTEGVDCAQRRLAVCPTGNAATLIRADEVSGKVRNLKCRSMAVAAAGDRRPGCKDSESESNLAIGLVQCN